MENGMYSPEYGDQGYMEQEEEWEREGLLDPAWEKQQKKVSLSFPKFSFLGILKNRQKSNLLSAKKIGKMDCKTNFQ